MSHKIPIPMSWWDFHHYISDAREQNDWIDNFYKLGFEGLAEHITSYDNVLELLTYIFHDYAEIINTWVYENNYGRSDAMIIKYDNKEYNTEKEIYELLCELFSKQYCGDNAWTNIEITRRI